jgi:S1-C subfamily serine protease
MQILAGCRADVSAWGLLAAQTLAIVFAVAPLLFAQDTLPSLIKQVQPSIVSILTYTEDGKPYAQGSGFAAYTNGLWVTNRHVMQGAYKATVKFADGEETEVAPVRASENDAFDLVGMELVGTRVRNALSLSSHMPEAGDRVVVIGSPLGLDQSVSDGIVSAIRLSDDGLRQIQITAPISHGSSGSPVLNLRGEVLGVATSMLRNGQNLNFAIPSENIPPLQTGKRYLLPEYSDRYVNGLIQQATQEFAQHWRKVAARDI